MMGAIGSLAQAVPEATGLTAAGATIMAISTLGVLALSAFCMNKILREKPPSTNQDGKIDIDARDADT